MFPLFFRLWFCPFGTLEMAAVGCKAQIQTTSLCFGGFEWRAPHSSSITPNLGPVHKVENETQPLCTSSIIISSNALQSLCCSEENHLASEEGFSLPSAEPLGGLAGAEGWRYLLLATCRFWHLLLNICVNVQAAPDILGCNCLVMLGTSFCSEYNQTTERQ